MLEKERAYVQQIENMHEHMRRMQKFVHTLIKFNNNNHNNNHVNNSYDFERISSHSFRIHLHVWMLSPKVI